MLVEKCKASLSSKALKSMLKYRMLLRSKIYTKVLETYRKQIVYF